MATQNNQTESKAANRDSRPWMPPLTRNGRMSGAAESILIMSAVMGIVALTSVIAVAQYKTHKTVQANAAGEFAR